MATRSISSHPSRAGSIDLVRGAPLLLVFAACGFSVNGQGPVSDDAPRDSAGGEGAGSDGGITDAPPDGDIDPPIDAPVDAPIDAAACPAAPSGDCTVFQCGTSSCYYLCGAADKQPWSDAEAACTDGIAGDAHLVTIDDLTENMCLDMNAAPNGFDDVWIGYRQANNQSSPSAGWAWIGGSTSTYTHWHGGEPNDLGFGEHGDEDCAAMSDDGEWNDAICGLDKRWICELP